jgi:hypothetical protein
MFCANNSLASTDNSISDLTSEYAFLDSSIILRYSCSVILPLIFNLLASKIEDYLAQTYQHDCSGNCYIPITFYSGQDNQVINISGASLAYDVSYAQTTLSLVQNSIYELNFSKSKIKP